MKKILITLLSITLSYSSFASLGPYEEAFEGGERILLDDELSEELKTIQGPVFLYSEKTDDLFKFDQKTGTVFTASPEEYETAALPPILLGIIIVGVVAAGVYINVVDGDNLLCFDKDLGSYYWCLHY